MQALDLRHPFPVELESSAKQEVLTIRAAFLGQLTDAQVDDWAAHLDESFFSLVRAGGLGGSRLQPCVREHPFDDTLAIADSEIGTVVEWELRDIQFAPEAVRVLANLCEYGMYSIPEHPIVRLALAYGDLGRLSPTPQYPDMWPGCPFEVEEYPIEDEGFDVEIVLASPIARDQIRALSGPVGAWLNTVVEGGFGGYPYDPARPGAQYNEKLTSSAGRSIVLHVQQFYASPDALESLKNVLAAVHHSGMRIERLVIAE